MDSTYKIVIVGDGGVGKTVFVNHHLNGNFEKKYISTIGCENHILKFNTNHGEITFHVFDCAGQEKFGGLGNEYYINAQGAIVMFSLDSKISYKNVQWWINKVHGIAPGIPIIICGNKKDEPNKIPEEQLPNVNYCEISVKDKLNLESPFVNLAKLLTGNDDLYFSDSASPADC